MPRIHCMDVTRFDLNLLLVLHALLTERNVTRAARRMHITQPAASNALRRLRDALEDPILVPGRHGTMELTPRALSLLGPVEDALKAVQRVLGIDVAFAPEKAELTVHIAVTEYVAFVLLPLLIRDLRQRAPAIRLNVHDVDKEDPLAPLRAGKVDLIAAFVPYPPKDLASQTLFFDRWVCIGRKDNKRAAGNLTIEQFARGHHVSSPMQTGGPASYIQSLLNERGIVRDIVVSMPHYLAVPHVVSSTDLIMTIPERLARTLTKQMPLQVYSHPLTIPEFAVSMLWHHRTDVDSAQKWVREALAAAGERVSCDRRGA